MSDTGNKTITGMTTVATAGTTAAPAGFDRADRAEAFWNARPRLFQFLQQRTAEMMALPQLCCPHRRCRRSGCSFICVDDDGPDCLGTLTIEERDSYDLLLCDAMICYFDLDTVERWARTEFYDAVLEVLYSVALAEGRSTAALRTFWRRRSRLSREAGARKRKRDTA